MKRFVFGGLIFIFLPISALAGIDTSRDWQIVDDEPLRELSVCFHRSLSDDWRGWAQQAIDEVNTAGTGWTFETVPFTKDRCEVFLIARDIPESAGGSELEILDTLSGQDEALDGRANGAILTVDSLLEETVEWIDAADDDSDEFFDGWSTEAGAPTRDPVDVLIGQFMHLARVDENRNYSADRPDDDLADPKLPGEHYGSLSDSDVDRLKESSQAPLERDAVTLDYHSAESVELGPVGISLPSYAFGRYYGDVEFTYQEATNAPARDSVPEDYNSLDSAFELLADKVIYEPIEVTVSAEPEQALVRLEKQPWDLTPVEVGPNPSSWEPVEDAEFDEDSGTITFSINKPGYFGLASLSPQKSREYRRVSGSKIIGEDRIRRRQLIGDVSKAALEQVPAFLIGLLAGGLIVWVWTRLGSRPKKEADRNGVSHIDGF